MWGIKQVTCYFFTLLGSTKEVKPKFKKVKLKPQKKTPVEEDESDDEGSCDRIIPFSLTY